MCLDRGSNLFEDLSIINTRAKALELSVYTKTQFQLNHFAVEHQGSYPNSGTFHKNRTG